MEASPSGHPIWKWVWIGLFALVLLPMLLEVVVTKILITGPYL